LSTEPEIPRLPKPAGLSSVCGISCGMSAMHFFTLLENQGVTALVDTRRNRAYRDARFTHEDDLPYLCYRHRIAYVTIEELMPTAAMRQRFDAEFVSAKGEKRNPRAWTEFLQAYAARLIQGKILAEGAVLRELLYNKGEKSVAFLCACQHHLDCHRRVLLGVLQRYIEGLPVIHLSPEAVGGKKPRRKSPVRRLLEPIAPAGLAADGLR
jgi:uncharacterized protein YeaO (DUF488 family)